MAKDKTLIERLQSGEEITCQECQKGRYVTPAEKVSMSHEFRCDKCGSVVRVTPNVIVE